MRKVIISLAPIPGPAEQVLKEAVVLDIVKSIDAGAAMCHIHSKDTEGNLTPDISLLTELFEKVREKRDVVIQASTGGISKMSIQERCYPLQFEKVESASLNGGSTNLGEAVYLNSFEDIRYCAKICYEKNILPEIEVFDIGMINNVNLVREELPFRNPVLFNLVFGHKGGMQPTLEALCAFKSFVPTDSLWGVTHFGRDNWTFLAAAIAMGATVIRIGFEDSAYLEEGIKAEANYQVVERLVQLIRAMGLEPATPGKAREILKLEQK